MSELDQFALSGLENVIGSVPGGNLPVVRSAYGAALGTAAVLAAKPHVMFTPDGQPRAWVVTSPEDPEATIFPWLAGPLIGAFALGVLI